VALPRFGRAVSALELVVRGAVRIDITDGLPLEQVAEAHRRLKSGATNRQAAGRRRLLSTWRAHQELRTGSGAA
jgi:hypothetical protein